MLTREHKSASKGVWISHAEFFFTILSSLATTSPLKGKAPPKRGAVLHRLDRRDVVLFHP